MNIARNTVRPPTCDPDAYELARSKAREDVAKLAGEGVDVRTLIARFVSGIARTFRDQYLVETLAAAYQRELYEVLGLLPQGGAA